MSPFKNKVVLVGLTGSIAIYKSCDLVRRLKEEGAKVHCLMSAGAQKFISPLTFSALSGNPVSTEIWDEKLWEMAHIKLAEAANLFIIAPATTHSLARLACGLAEDIVSATAMASDAPVLVVPAMHEAMWKHPATQKNVKQLKSFGVHFVGPEYGALLGRDGWGRMAETQTILTHARKLL
jgi:phosphopantothenoylcysteine synthetase/decarboxylase